MKNYFETLFKDMLDLNYALIFDIFKYLGLQTIFIQRPPPILSGFNRRLKICDVYWDFVLQQSRIITLKFKYINISHFKYPLEICVRSCELIRVKNGHAYV